MMSTFVMGCCRAYRRIARAFPHSTGRSAVMDWSSSAKTSSRVCGSSRVSSG